MVRIVQGLGSASQAVGAHSPIPAQAAPILPCDAGSTVVVRTPPYMCEIDTNKEQMAQDRTIYSLVHSVSPLAKTHDCN